MRKLIENKKGSDAPSIIFAIVSIFIIGIILFVFVHLGIKVLDTLKTNLENNPQLNSQIANNTLTDVQRYNQSMWDYVFLFIVAGYVISMIILAFSTQANAYFYVIFIIIAGLGVFVGFALSSAWEKLAAVPEFSTTLTYFPITDSILNNFFPLFVAFIFVSVMIMLFGKRFFGDSSSGGLG